MKRVTQFLDDFWARWESILENFHKAAEADIKELEEAGGETTKKVVTEERDGFTYKVTTVTTRLRGMFEGDGYFSARQVAHVIASRYNVDHDDWVAARLAVLRAQGENAKARVVWTKKNGKYVFQVMVRREDGSVEQTPPLKN